MSSDQRSTPSPAKSAKRVLVRSSPRKGVEGFGRAAAAAAKRSDDGDLTGAALKGDSAVPERWGDGASVGDAPTPSDRLLAAKAAQKVKLPATKQVVARRKVDLGEMRAERTPHSVAPTESGQVISTQRNTGMHKDLQVTGQAGFASDRVPVQVLSRQHSLLGKAHISPPPGRVEDAEMTLSAILDIKRKSQTKTEAFAALKLTGRDRSSSRTHSLRSQGQGLQEVSTFQNEKSKQATVVRQP